MDNLRVVEIDSKRSQRLKEELNNRLAQFGVDPSHASSIVLNDDFLKCELDQSDIFVGNPPYVRYDNLTLEQREYCRKWFRLFRDRCDLYVPFFEKAFRFLSSQGRVCYITPDRWLKNQYGKSLRKFIATHYSVPAVFSLDGTNPFEEEVYGYPLVSLITSERVDHTRHWAIQDLRQLKEAVESFVNNNSSVVASNTTTPAEVLQGERWIFESTRLPYASADFLPMEDQGFVIGIGVASGLDSVFVRRDFEKYVEAQLLLPMVLSRDIVDGQIRWSGHHIFNPFNSRGNLIDLDRFPMAKRYLLSNAKLLRKRHVARNHPRQWYRTIDRIHPELLLKPKLLLPDIKKGSLVALDPGKYYPHHNIYYVIGGSLDELKELGAVLMSKMFRKQLAAQSVIMHGGFVRHQSQNLRAVRLPKLSNLPSSVRRSLAVAFDAKDPSVVDSILEVELQESDSPIHG